MRDSLIKADGCSEKSVEFTIDYMKSIAQNVLDMVCGEYNELTDKCAKLGKLPHFCTPRKLCWYKFLHLFRTSTKEEAWSEKNQIVRHSCTGIAVIVSRVLKINYQKLCILGPDIRLHATLSYYTSNIILKFRVKQYLIFISCWNHGIL